MFFSVTLEGISALVSISGWKVFSTLKTLSSGSGSETLFPVVLRSEYRTLIVSDSDIFSSCLVISWSKVKMEVNGFSCVSQCLAAEKMQCH